MTSLSGGRAYRNKVTQKDGYDETSWKPFPKQQAPIGFIYLPPSEQSSDNPYATQEAYDPSYKPILNDTAGGTTENNEENEIEKEGIFYAELEAATIAGLKDILFLPVVDVLFVPALYMLHHMRHIISSYGNK